jgi:hypothetical protein
MIRYVGCDYARPRLDAFADGELPMGDQVLVETHLRWCQTCAARLEDAQTIGDALRLTARAHAHQDGRAPVDDGASGRPGDLSRSMAAMQAEVLARANTEYEQSFSGRVEELFSDMRLLWPALGATLAVALSVGLASNVWKATSDQQPASLAAMIESLAEPGSNRNPQRLDAAMYLPRLEDGAAFDDAVLAEHHDNQQDELFAVAAVLTREGRVGDYALLERGGLQRLPTSVAAGSDGEALGVLHAVRQSRFAPAQRPGRQVVAVNMVLLFARTTVKASHQTVDLGTPLTRPVLAVPPPAPVKPVGLPAEGASSQEQSVAPIESATV